MIEIHLKDLSEGPVYLQVRQQMERAVSAGTLQPNETLPSPASLAQKLSVDKGEIQRAYYELERAGLISKKTTKDFLGKEKTTYSVK